ncbi:MAG: transposase [Candidatus Endonucleobacter bathymodioli]|uniref:Mutator family transposase n=1 Tax=Candidatus Endonucleibacter bathymodioli TaxID=539814 RepID=A0AA90NNC0_9GAMM|nr:transposase [Candidatus Endonucleobacter bathymodioli]
MTTSTQDLQDLQDLQDKTHHSKYFTYFSLEEKWLSKYPQISRSWRQNWDNLNTFFAYPEEVRKAIYTTNAIESWNSVTRKAIKKLKLFPHDDSAKKVVYLATCEASKNWTMPIRNWRSALNHFMIVFETRLSDYV